MNKNIKAIFAGMIVGIFDLLPGISGSTILYILNIYKKIINIINSINKTYFKLILNMVFKFKTKEFLKYHKKNNLNFGLFLILGVIISIFLFSKVIKYFIDNYKFELYLFFIFLISGSLIYFYKKLEQGNYKVKLFVVYGALLSYFLIKFVSTFTIEVNHMSLIILGTTMSIFMILPGISGSQILLNLGIYNEITTMFSTADLSKMLAFGIGIIVGIMFFSRFIKHFLENHKNKSYHFIFGLIFGSLVLLIQNHIL